MKIPLWNHSVPLKTHQNKQLAILGKKRTFIFIDNDIDIYGAQSSLSIPAQKYICS